ncbi:MAG: glycosyltransferase [Thermoplasmatota archaeon]
MKIAILHNAITEGNNGSEKLVYLLAKEIKARIYTSDYDSRVEGSYPGIEELVEVDQIPHPDSFTRKDYEIMRSMTKRKDVDADFIIYSGNQTVFRVKKDITPYLYFCHTPERGFFDLHDDLMKKMKQWGYFNYLISKILFEKRRRMDIRLFKEHVDPKKVVTNSKMVMDRYERCYGKRPRASVGAPIETSRYRWSEPEDYLLSAGGLRWNKRIDWLIRAVSETGDRLLIAGDGPERRRLEELAKKKGANADFLGRVDDKGLIDLYSRCRAFLFSARNEDFGMVPLEALASGKPVVSVSEGGPMEYLDGKTAFFFKDVGSLVGILKGLDNNELVSMKEKCIERAKYFDTSEFSKRIMGHVSSIYKDN